MEPLGARDIPTTQQNRAAIKRRGGLSDEDVDRIVDELENRLTSRFIHNIGKGVLALTWKGIVMGIIAIAAYGAFKVWK